MDQMFSRRNTAFTAASFSQLHRITHIIHDDEHDRTEHIAEAAWYFELLGNVGP